MIEMVRQLGVTSGNLGQTNQFQGIGQGNEGVVSINLRGLGAARTLTLINGRRQVATESNGVDVSIIPTSALARTEVLLGGAAATYGSDAIAGVVNFITRGDFEGFEIGASNQWVDDAVRTAGNQQYNAIWGMGGDQWNVMVAAEYDYLSEIHVKDRDWALQPFAENPAGGWSSIGNPGTYYPAIPTANNLPPPTATGATEQCTGCWRGGAPDPGCAAVGGVVVGTATAGTCRFQYTFFDNLQEKTETSKLFTEFNYDVSDTYEVPRRGAVLVPRSAERQDVAGYPPQSLFGPDRWIAPNHPGLVAMKAANPRHVQHVVRHSRCAQAIYSQSRYLGVTGLDGHPQSGSASTSTLPARHQPERQPVRRSDQLRRRA